MNMKQEIFSGVRADSQKICLEMLDYLHNNLLNKWYPLVIDQEFGGYLTNISYDFKLMPEQEKMIVTQARHMWTTAKAADFFNNENFYNYSLHGFDFIKNKMWDSEFGGYFQIRNREGGFSDVEKWNNEKRVYGNAFAVYGLAALYNLTNDKGILAQAKKSFEWIETHSYDPKYDGYFQFLTRESIPFDNNSEYKSEATDAVEIGFKDQNSSIHLLEAYTELYNAWKDENVFKQLHGLLILIRDVIIHPKGYLRLFFQNNWQPVSFKNSPPEIREANYRLDHVSFGHDYETAFLMLEASHVLGLEDDIRTLRTAKKLIDHSIKNGWDKINGGFFDEGYYFDENGKCEIIKETKNWWAQAEGLNALLLFAKIFPEEKIYYDLFLQQWDYIKNYLIDHENGDWYWGSLEKEPHHMNTPKGSIWKATYHNGRSLMNCIKMLSDENFDIYRNNEKFRILKNEFDHFIIHWKQQAKYI